MLKNCPWDPCQMEPAGMSQMNSQVPTSLNPVESVSNRALGFRVLIKFGLLIWQNSMLVRIEPKPYPLVG